MIKFNSENIFVGHIKQLLASFNLPKYHVYTEDQLNYHNKYLEAKANISKVETEINELEQKIIVETDEEKRAELYRQQYDLKELVKKYEDIIANGPEQNVIVSAVRNIAPTYPTNETTYPTYMRYIPYIKNNNIQIYAPKIINGQVEYSDNDWKDCHATYAENHSKIHTKNANLVTPKGYVYGLKIRNYTKNLKIQNNTYDSYTHEYLGDYLRFQRDYRHINLMSLYNCFSNRLCPKLKLEFDVYTNANGEGGYTASFDTDNTKYKIYMVPIKLFKQYTLAIDSMSDVEVCCGFFNQYQYPDTYNEIALKTYQCFNSMNFGEPVLYDKVKELNSYLSINHNLEVAQHEQDLKLFIKLPASNKSSIVILEGDYTAYTNATLIKYYPTDKSKHEVPKVETAYIDTENNIIHMEVNDKISIASDYPDVTCVTHDATIASITQDGLVTGLRIGTTTIGANNEITVVVEETVVPTTRAEPTLNMETVVDLGGNWYSALFEDGILDLQPNELLYSTVDTTNEEELALRNFTTQRNERETTGHSFMVLTNHTELNLDGDVKENLKHLSSPLQLLSQNTGVSYPFADRLIEFLVDNMITPADEISDNIARAKKVVEARTNSLQTEDGIWEDLMQILIYNYMSKNYDRLTNYHDILGYVDKDTERIYSNGSKTKKETIASADIYGDWED